MRERATAEAQRATMLVIHEPRSVANIARPAMWYTSVASLLVLLMMLGVRLVAPADFESFWMLLYHLTQIPVTILGLVMWQWSGAGPLDTFLWLSMLSAVTNAAGFAHRLVAEIILCTKGDPCDIYGHVAWVMLVSAGLFVVMDIIVALAARAIRRAGHPTPVYAPFRRGETATTTFRGVRRSGFLGYTDETGYAAEMMTTGTSVQKIRPSASPANDDSTDESIVAEPVVEPANMRTVYPL